MDDAGEKGGGGFGWMMLGKGEVVGGWVGGCWLG